MSLNWEINLTVALTKNSVKCNAAATFTIADTKLYVQLVTLSSEDNAKLIPKLKPGFKRTCNWSKYQSKIGILIVWLIQVSKKQINFLYNICKCYTPRC